MAKINWDDMLKGGYVQIEEGVPKELKLRNWRPQTQFKDDKTGEVRPGLVFDVYKDGNTTFDDTSKIEYTITAKGAMKEFRPIIEEAEAANQEEIHVTVVAVGKGKERKYSIKKAN